MGKPIHRKNNSRGKQVTGKNPQFTGKPFTGGNPFIGKTIRLENYS